MMRKTVLIVVTVLLLAGTVYGLYDPNNTYTNESGDGDISITGTGSPSASSGQDWTVTVEKQGQTCFSGEHESGVSDIQYSGEDTADGKQQVSWTGAIQTPTPCYAIDHTVDRTGENSYVLDVTTERMDGGCVECVGRVSYGATFETSGGYTLEIRHDGETVETIGQDAENGSSDPDPPEEKPKRGGFLSGLWNWLTGLF